jgi:AAA15 family ATPase/GTPase
MSGMEFATATHYSKLVKVEIENFMSLKHAIVEFDERGIINLKGYNDVGKSNILRALEVLLDDSHPTKQLNFIRDDEDYFKVTAFFDDDISIERSKFIDGKSLYEMYKGGKLLFTTRVNNNLTKISGVPQPIKDYLGLISEDEFFLNSRSCYQPQIIVETTGSQNYRFFSVVLHSEELSLTHTMLNTDKNAKNAELNLVDHALTVRKGDLEACTGVGMALVEVLESLNGSLDTYEEILNLSNELSELQSRINGTVVYPTLSSIPTGDIDLLLNLLDIQKDIDNIIVYPKLNKVDTEVLSSLAELDEISRGIASLVTLPKLETVNTSILRDLAEIQDCYNTVSNLKVYPKISSIESGDVKILMELEDILTKKKSIEEQEKLNASKLEQYRAEVEAINSKLMSVGIRTIKCKNCGTIMEVDD